MFVLLEDHETVLVAAVLGATFATNVKDAVRGNVSVVRLSDTPVASVKTRTITDADLFPSWVDTVITVDPFPTAVISPVLDTVAIVGCKDLHDTDLFVAFEGRTVATD